MAVPKLKMIYFPTEGRGECIRMICAAGGIPLEEEIMPFSDWHERKPTFQFNQLPVLVIDGQTTIAQHLSICRYVGKLANLAGKDALEAAQIESFADACSDLYFTDFLSLILLPVVMNSNMQEFKNLLKKILGDKADQFEGHPETKAEAFKQYAEKGLNPMLDRYERVLANSSSGWLTGDKMTWADIYVAEFMNRMVTKIDKSALDNHPNVRALVDKVFAVPAIASYVETKPNYEF